jgi:hypothetical protein
MDKTSKRLKTLARIESEQGQEFMSYIGSVFTSPGVAQMQIARNVKLKISVHNPSAGVIQRPGIGNQITNAVRVDK